MASAKPIRERIEMNVARVPECGCWLWMLTLSNAGYGLINIGQHTKSAHRVAWEAFWGLIPAGLCVLHRCDVRSCVNPAHLFLGTHSDNGKDMVQKGRNRDRRGALNGQSKLGTAEVLEIRARRRDGISVIALGKQFGVHRNHIYDILSGERWSHVK